MRKTYRLDIINKLLIEYVEETYGKLALLPSLPDKKFTAYLANKNIRFCTEQLIPGLPIGDHHFVTVHDPELYLYLKLKYQ